MPQTLLWAHQARQQFRSSSDGELAAWLRQILTRTLLHCVRDYQRSKREVDRKRSLDAACEAWSARPEAWLAAEQSSPSHHVAKLEEAVGVAAAVQARLVEAADGKVSSNARTASGPRSK